MLVKALVVDVVVAVVSDMRKRAAPARPCANLRGTQRPHAVGRTFISFIHVARVVS